jgi:HrpA-like RNA helicase
MEAKYGEGVQKKAYEIKSSSDEYEAILRCILTGYFMNIAQIQGDGSYLNIRSKEKLTIHSTSILSVVYPEWIVYHQIIKSSQHYIHNGSQIDPDWIV